MSDIDPAILTWVARIAELSQTLPDLASPDMRARRAAELTLSNMLADEFTEQSPSDVTIKRGAISTTVGDVHICRYRPAGLPSPAPTELFLHGGGFVSGSVDELINDRLLTRRAQAANIQVIAMDYRLAPEHPYPAPVDDTIATLDALRAQAVQYDVDVSLIGIGGASAGAGIAASSVLHLRDRGDHVLVHQSLEVPALSFGPFGSSAVEYAHGFGLDDFEQLAEMVLPGEARSDPNAQPLLATDLSGLPPTFLQVAEHDPLRDAGLAYGERLIEAGVRCAVHLGHGHVHGSPGLTATFAAARTWQAQSASAARLAYQRP